MDRDEWRKRQAVLRKRARRTTPMKVVERGRGFTVFEAGGTLYARNHFTRTGQRKLLPLRKVGRAK